MRSINTRILRSLRSEMPCSIAKDVSQRAHYTLNRPGACAFDLYCQPSIYPSNLQPDTSFQSVGRGIWFVKADILLTDSLIVVDYGNNTLHIIRLLQRNSPGNHLSVDSLSFFAQSLSQLRVSHVIRAAFYLAPGAPTYSHPLFMSRWGDQIKGVEI